KGMRTNFEIKVAEGVVAIDDSRYPALLKTINNPPLQLYYKGNWNEAIFSQCLAVVGTRKMTRYGRQITEELIQEVAAAGITIVSGFMYGIDAIAHKAALDVGGKTIAVMPGGIDVISPSYQEPLRRAILDGGGLVISEHPGNYPPMLWTYPRRNRIIAGLSKVTVVVEAGKVSGALITARLARKFSRKLFAVPGSLTSTVSEGTAWLIKQGASIVTNAGDILAEYNKDTVTRLNEGSVCNKALGSLGQAIIDYLRREPMEIDALCRSLKVSISQMSAALCLMQVRGLVCQEEGKFHVC
ncbi:MAG: DNA-processing protein DprA, partial [Candidatus Omnitrophica bacterium]|nr:DNA-processing protein DprA [Candidatus Omnitrophota bacterium]MBU1367308.1 DNA-processing protein DprA [Candidatus Omnitrophota bacterium]MBU1523555.1 DNA-processing protein DprA [Candidatus Omnitrophota bacterium]MBU2504787.1 DNA-processing protein DprA [Candidatus Omnitrophota bacterium]